MAKYQIEAIPDSGNYSEMDPNKIVLTSNKIELSGFLRNLISNNECDQNYFKTIEFISRPDVPIV